MKKYEEAIRSLKLDNEFLGMANPKIVERNKLAIHALEMFVEFGWKLCSDGTPPIGDYSVLVWFGNLGTWDMVHVSDYFDDVTCGTGENGEQLYTKRYISENIVAWKMVEDFKP